MGFFLVGRTSGGELALISPEVFGSRQEALAALTTISADPAFAHRDSEVFVGNLDQATPILLVAPAAAAEVPREHTEDPAEGAEEPIEELPREHTEEPAEGPEELAPADAGVWEAPEDAVEEGSGLADAIKRAAGALESEGIVAPDSIGPEPVLPEAASTTEAALTAEATSPAETSPTPETAWPWDAAPVTEPESTPEPVAETVVEVDEPIAAIADIPAAEETPAQEPPSEEPAVEEPPAEVPALEEPPVEEPAIEEPPAEVPAYVPDPFEEPSVDGGDIVSARADDETVALGRPVVMGAYSDSTFEAVVEPASIAEPAPGAGGTEPATAEDTDVAESDSLEGMLADLEPIEPIPGGFAGSDSGEALTCADCVYEQTCPNKEGLDPSQCGNFQWKAH